MIIGINAAAAVKQPRTGVEEYTYQLIKHLTMLTEAREHRFFLFIPSFEKGGLRRIYRGKKIPPSPLFTKGGEKNLFDFPLPSNFEIKILRWPLPFLWTQIRLAWEIWRRKPDVLFMPVHILPFGAPKNSVVTIHGLEYEYWPEHYPFWHRLYLKWSTARALQRARRIIAVSENTKNDLIKFYNAKAEKIGVVHHGVSVCHSDPVAAGEESPANAGTGLGQAERSFAPLGMTTVEKPYLLYIGRIETKKNVQGVLEAYKILKEQYKIPHQLVLAGASGYGYKKIKKEIISSNKSCYAEIISTPYGIPKQVWDDKVTYHEKIVDLGYVSEEEKWQLLSNADIFLFPSFYEGFGIPVLEAQAAGASVITSYGSCLPEIAGEGALFVNPKNPAQIAEIVKRIIDDKILRDRLRQSGFENVKRFSWEKCARETLETILNFKG